MSAIDFIDLEFDEWKHRDEDPNLLMRDFHYTKPMSGIGPKEVYCQGQCSAIIHPRRAYIVAQLSDSHGPSVQSTKRTSIVTRTLT